jgi:hypothetical protein
MWRMPTAAAQHRVISALLIRHKFHCVSVTHFLRALETQLLAANSLALAIKPATNDGKFKQPNPIAYKTSPLEQR